MKNYLLLACKILQRHKFYTCISLFGISVTLMVLILVTSMIESFVHPRGPEINSDRFLVVPMMRVQQSTGRSTNRSSSQLGYRFVENRILPMRTPELISVFSGSIGMPGMTVNNEAVGFRDEVKIKSAVKRTDANYWKILQFDFLEGRPVSEQEHQQGAYVAVISEATRGHYFPGENAVGKSIELDGSRFQVIGVVRNVSPLQTIAVADVWLPIFATQSTQFRTEDRGEFIALMLARRTDDLPLIKEEYQVVVQNTTPPQMFWMQQGYPVEFSSSALSKADFYAQTVTQLIGRGSNDTSDEQLNKARNTVLIVLGIAALMFMLLPVINLVNINISRILDRSSEIGVRKSFGASSSHLVRQFIVENLVITFIGGALGFLLAIGALTLIAQSGLLPGEEFNFNYRIFTLALLYIMVFSLMSAVYPAWKMSRLDPVRALKGAVS